MKTAKFLFANDKYLFQIPSPDPRMSFSVSVSSNQNSSFPRLSKFCFCLDLHTGVQYSSIVFITLWIVYLLQHAFGWGLVYWNIWWRHSSILCVIFAIVNVIIFILVLYGMYKRNKNFLIPALVVCSLDIILCLIEGIYRLYYNDWSGLLVLFIALFTVYYVIALKNVYNDMAGVTVRVTVGP